MLRYIERAGLVVPERSECGYRLYSLREVNQLRSLAALRKSFGVEITDVAFAARLGGVGAAQARTAPGRLTP